MKRIGISLLAAMIAGVAMSDGPDKVTPKKPRIPLKMTAAYQKRYGGEVIQPGTMNGKFLILDETGHDAETARVLKQIKLFFRIDTGCVKPSEKAEVANAARLIFKAGGNVGVFLVERDDMPTILTAPQNRFAFVNVKPLKSDAPDAEKLASRIRKELWRGFAFICGGGTSDTPGCVMNPVMSLGDLDYIGTEMISPDGGKAMSTCFKMIGITPYRQTSYLQACREGWAPAPTNEYQKAIWEKIKNGKTDATDPTNRWKRDFPGKK